MQTPEWTESENDKRLKAAITGLKNLIFDSGVRITNLSDQIAVNKAKIEQINELRGRMEALLDDLTRDKPKA